MNILKKRKKTKKIKIKNIFIGGNSPITVQSMCNIKTEYYRKVINQIRKLVNAGCEIIRVSVKDNNDIEGLKKICNSSEIPVIADIHFNYKLALKSIDAGVSKLRVNPGNITNKWKIKEIIKSAKGNNIPIRVGVNYGSLEQKLVEKVEAGKMSPENAVVESALKEVSYLEELDFYNIIVSLKTSDVLTTIKCYKLFAKKRKYPLHIGITETGTLRSGLIKSGIGLGNLLMEGIGDTMRISLSTDPIEEIYAAYNILKTLKIRKGLPELISCPTCGRTEINLIKLANEVEKILYSIKKPIKIAVMGCVVNGPGEAREADIGITGGKGVGLIFSKGKIIKKIKEKNIIPELIKIINKF